MDHWVVPPVVPDFGVGGRGGVAGAKCHLRRAWPEKGSCRTRKSEEEKEGFLPGGEGKSFHCCRKKDTFIPEYENCYFIYFYGQTKP